MRLIILFFVMMNFFYLNQLNYQAKNRPSKRSMIAEICKPTPTKQLRGVVTQRYTGPGPEGPGLIRWKWSR